MQLANLLAEATEALTDTVKLDEIYDILTAKFGFQTLLVLTAVTMILCVVIFMRQKKIAQNQVDLAKVMEQLLDKK